MLRLRRYRMRVNQDPARSLLSRQQDDGLKVALLILPGAQLLTARSVDEHCNDSSSSLVGDGPWLGESKLAHHDIAYRALRQVRLLGLDESRASRRSET